MFLERDAKILRNERHPDLIVNMNLLVLICINFIYKIDLVSSSMAPCSKLPIIRENECIYECRNMTPSLVYCKKDSETAIICNQNNSCPLGTCLNKTCYSSAESTCEYHLSKPLCTNVKSTVINPRSYKPDKFNGGFRYEAYQPYVFSLVLALIPLVMFLVYRITRYAMQLQIDAREAVEPPPVNPRALNRSYSQRRQSSSRSSVYSASRSPRHSISRSPNQSGARSPIRNAPRSPNQLTTNFDTLRVEAPTILIIQPQHRTNSLEVPTDLPPPYSAVETSVDMPPSYTEAMEIIEKSKPTD